MIFVLRDNFRIWDFLIKEGKNLYENAQKVTHGVMYVVKAAFLLINHVLFIVNI